MYAFREGRRRIPSARILADVVESLRLLELQPANQELILNTLLRLGAFECSLADAGSTATLEVARITENVAARLLLSKSSATGRPLTSRRLPAAQQLPESLTLSVPEGFAYYNLDPLAYADAALTLVPADVPSAIIGVRSIGSTLSAVVLAALQAAGRNTSRITVRPTGHPFQRSTEFDREQQSWLSGMALGTTRFLVVDEGPGLSGSSFLSVGDALISLGIPAANITFLCAHVPDFSKLCAPNAQARAARFQWRAVSGSGFGARDTDLSGGAWREHLCREDRNFWPASWSSMERRKFLTADGEHLWKFEGLGPYGEANLRRAQKLHQLRFGPEPLEFSGGFIRYPLLRGRHCAAENVSEALLQKLARYCALRGEHFQLERGVACVEGVDLSTMLRVNLQAACGTDDIAINLGHLHPANWKRTVYCDGRMQPHEWLVLPDSRMVKTDGTSHGDDHFFPGPTDIAWDLAGVIVEWELAPEETTYFLKSYQRASGDDASERLPAFLLAYAAFRLGYCRTAADAMRGSEEEPRLRNSATRYLNTLRVQLEPEALGLTA